MIPAGAAPGIGVPGLSDCGRRLSSLQAALARFLARPITVGLRPARPRRSRRHSRPSRHTRRHTHPPLPPQARFRAQASRLAALPLARPGFWALVTPVPERGAREAAEESV